MISFNGFKGDARMYIYDAYCQNKRCKGNELKQVSDGIIGIALFCTKCNQVYQISLTKAKNVKKEFLEHCLETIEFEKEEIALHVIVRQRKLEAKEAAFQAKEERRRKRNEKIAIKFNKKTKTK